MRLGYDTLENECERHGGFVVDDSVSEVIEVAGFQLLEDICKEIFDGYFVLKQWPEHKIIVNDRASYHGMATVYKRKQMILNNYGLYIRYDVKKIYLKKSIFKKDGYYDGLSTYVHELCHMFGGDSSVSFSLALTYAMELLMRNPVIVKYGYEKWCRIFEENEVLEITKKGEGSCG